MQFGSTEKHPDDQLTDNEKMAREVRAKTLNMTGLSAELQIQKQRIEDLYVKYDHMTRLVMTLQNQLNAEREARVRELGLRVNNGPTEH